MPVRLAAVRLAAQDPARLVAFWSALLDRQPDGDLLPGPGAEVALGSFATREPKTEPLRGHLDLTSASLEDQQETVARALRLGGRHHDVGQLGTEGHVVLADPEGNELCVIEPDNRFLAGCGRVGAVACDGTREVGLFWAAALGWPLVWDEGEETAVQSPLGGTTISWGGSPLAVRRQEDRLRFELVLEAGSDREAEVERLVGLGARLLDVPAEGATVLADPDGSAFHLLPA